MPNNNDNKYISSAEMTAFWRCQLPKLSNDEISFELVSHEGKEKAIEYGNNDYPHAARQMSIRAGYFYQACLNLLNTKSYDSVISFGSGFSLLTLITKEAINSNKIYIIDSDLQSIILERNRRIANNKFINQKLLTHSKMKSMALDLEKAYLSKKKLSDFLPSECKSPIFIIEGLIYFLSLDCQSWLFSQIKDKSQFTQSALVLDYWPADAPKRSRLFRENVLPFFAEKTTAENVRELMSPKYLQKLKEQSLTYEDISLGDAEEHLIPDNSEKIFSKLSPDEYIPIQFTTFTY